MDVTPGHLVTLAATQGVTATLHPTKRIMHSVEAAAEALGIPHDHMTKNLLFMIDADPLLLVARGSLPVDRRGLARHFGVGRKRVRLATPEQTLAVSGYPIGCVPPFGHATFLRTLVQPGVLDLPRIYGGTSDPRILISVTTGDFLEMTGATVLSDRDGSTS